MEFKVSVPGKVILHGEHSVVYGKAAVAAAIGLRTEAEVQSSKDVTLNLKDFGQKFTWRLDEFKKLDVNFGDGEVAIPSEDILKCLRSTFNIGSDTKWHGSLVTFLFLYNGIAQKQSKSPKNFLPVELIIHSTLPIGAGLGSSAAYSVAVAASLLRLFKVVPSKGGVPAKEDLEIISKWAFQSEVILHGKPSGIDNSICTFGGALLFQKGRIQEINSNVPLYRVLLVNTQVPRNTRALVAHVKERVERQPTIMASTFEAMDEIAWQTWRTLKANSVSGQGTAAAPADLATKDKAEVKTNQKLYEFAAELISMNHHLLNAIGVGHPILDRIVTVAGTVGFSAKLTGAGGGGCGFILLGVGEPEKVKTNDVRADNLRELLIKEGLQFWSVDMGCAGVTFS
ncbi:mevalonate kinase-like isoform X1 [Varroa jacobsoni]|nr:mevalonate kinase-like isoform X2 [Varroa destructor]XP_022654808.1 mevalonate kinase-like isoform X2 [Varroa destructor]XP_022690442.1 mevalonate kinase-like isoform X1 [Varroa jacobsoni]XP_022690443.1 mevalonate kinase-like isoform X1 [Varroa jacobsoni]XP_022690444.1 mevalonate kinase-like isoform X1 [Varroa jacobsoni]